MSDALKRVAFAAVTSAAVTAACAGSWFNWAGTQCNADGTCGALVCERDAWVCVQPSGPDAAPPQDAGRLDAAGPCQPRATDGGSADAGPLTTAGEYCAAVRAIHLAHVEQCRGLAARIEEGSAAVPRMLPCSDVEAATASLAATFSAERAADCVAAAAALSPCRSDFAELIACTVAGAGATAAPCYNDLECDAEHWCRTSWSAGACAGTCQPRATASCGAAAPCPRGEWCSNGTCQAREAGKPCATEEQAPPEFYCDALTARWKARAMECEACTHDAQCLPIYSCAGVCRRRASKDEPCQTRADCEPGLVCEGDPRVCVLAVAGHLGCEVAPDTCVDSYCLEGPARACIAFVGESGACATSDPYAGPVAMYPCDDAANPLLHCDLDSMTCSRCRRP